MLKPDIYFQNIQNYFPVVDQPKARLLFRRAIRQYYAMKRIYVIDPVSGMRVQRVFTGEIIQIQKTQRRRVQQFFKGHTSIGRPKRLEIKILLSKLFTMWGRFATTPTTFSWKTGLAKKTSFELFLNDLLPRIGASDVRRYIEKHWLDIK